MFTTQTDKALTCHDCRQPFTFTATEQQFYADRQFSEPRRCSSCRAIRKASRGAAGDGAGYASRSYERRARDMFSVTCSQCGREAQVPFRPNGLKPVYCSDCFTTQRRSY